MREISYAQALNEALRQNMAQDENIIVMGEDVGKYGGIFQVTAGLLDEFGAERVIDTPISEAGFVGAGVGAALAGLRPVVELMFIDFTTVAMDQIVNQMAKMHYMFGGRGRVPMVLRLNIGAGRGAAAQHSQSLHAWFMHVPGIMMAVPSNPYDAKGLLNTAIAEDNPVMFVEHKRLYAESGPVPEESYAIPFGQGQIKREGRDLTIVAVSAMVGHSLTAAQALSAQGIEAEVIDPRTIKPLDTKLIMDSIAKTGKLLVADEGHKTCGVAAEIAALAAEEAIQYLEAPIVRVCSPDTPVPYSPVLEDKFVPGPAQVEEAAKRLMQYA